MNLFERKSRNHNSIVSLLEFRQKRRKKKEFDFSPFVDNSDSPFANLKGRSSGNGADDVEAADGAGDQARWKRPLRPYEERGDPARLIEFTGEFVGEVKVEKSNNFSWRNRT